MNYYYDDDFFDDGGKSSLRSGNRVYPCPTCGEPNRLTETDVRHHYQCDECADMAEGFGQY